MAFYDLTKEERNQLVEKINQRIENDLENNTSDNILKYFSDDDTYIRKTGYLAIGKIFYAQPHLQNKILSVLTRLFKSEDELIRQTVVNAAGEIGKFHFDKIQTFMDIGLFDSHHRVRNAVIGSIKKMGERNPVPVLAWVKTYLNHENKEIRREICHGIELRGRTHPQDILPLLKELEVDNAKRVSDTLIHVLGQIAYKRGCLKTVVTHLNKWQNKELVQNALDEIVDVHNRYKKFAVLTQQEAIAYIDANYKA
ncbi:HEAT repeat domain-containing protein [Winogradskyella echinorum]|uniref:HEAT repeat domain-containing protein n=1 Tax=Winogradskyella echinorum TaxID=538189 RepID=A0ABR6XYN2_9FLAO|nr:HEAT repeat domain-containing protein [Winogradskyella echinorum]MBC3845608.1 HEAT repeat domain-containing protein [Winogradskyella echinorum]MBC5749956.1 HEAT repeat domain-containing protein [Winogradskyella echinorum]